MTWVLPVSSNLASIETFVNGVETSIEVMAVATLVSRSCLNC